MSHWGIFFSLIFRDSFTSRSGGDSRGAEPRLFPARERLRPHGTATPSPGTRHSIPGALRTPGRGAGHGPGASRRVPTLGVAPPRGAGLWGPESPAQSFGRRGENPEKRVRSGKERVNGSGSPRSGSHTPLPRAGLTHPGLGPAPRHPRAAPAAPEPGPSLRR